MWQAGLSRKSLAASTLASHGGSATKKVPQAPESRQLRRLHQGVFVWTALPHCGAFASFPIKLTNAWQLPSRGNEHTCNWLSCYSARLQVVPHFSSGIVERVKREHTWKLPHVRKGNTRLGERKMKVPHFSNALTFSSLYYPGAKIRDYNPLVVYNIFSWPTVRGTQRQFSENICAEDDLKSRIFGT